jgi:hypothetical protein
VTVASRHGPSERRHLRLEVAEIADFRHPRVRLDAVSVNDDDDLVQAVIRRRLKRLPELSLLELPVAGQHIDAARAAEEPIRQDETASLRDTHPQRSRARHDLWRGHDIWVARKAVQSPQLMHEFELEPAESGQDGV